MFHFLPTMQEQTDDRVDAGGRADVGATNQVGPVTTDVNGNNEYATHGHHHLFPGPGAQVRRITSSQGHYQVSGADAVGNHARGDLNPSGKFRVSPRMCRVDKRANCVVWCGNLPSSVDDRAVRAFFSTSQFIVRALNHVPSTQSAFIQLSSSDQVAPFISMYNGALFLDKAVICHAKKPPTCLVQTVQAQPNNAYTSTPIAQIPTVRTLPSNSVAHSVVLFEPATMAPLGLSAEPSESPAGPWASSIQPFSYSAPSALYPRDRYFILKTHSPQDVAFSQQCGVWAYSNNYMELVLRGAYEGCDNVFLIFGVNGSGGFCGVARMAGIGSEEAGLYVRDFRARNPIWTDTGKDWTVPFQVQWISGNFVPFEEMMHLNNPWNHNCLVRKSRDGVEVEPNVGYNLCWLLTNRL